MKKRLLAVLCILAMAFNVSGLNFTFASTTSASNTQINRTEIENRKTSKHGWVKYKDSRRYYLRNGKYAKGLYNIKGSVYYFDKYGKMQKYNHMVKGRPYYFNRDGKGAKRGWIKNTKGEKVYYSLGNGKLARGKNKIDGSIYYFGESGRIQKYNQMINGRPYYFNKDGKGAKRGWIRNTKGEKVYYSLGNGILARGKNKIDGSIYYFGESGRIQKYNQMIDGRPYYFNKDGKGAKRGWIRNTKGEKVYYSLGNGILARGKNRIDGNLYYFSNTGRMQKYYELIDGEPYYFRQSGAAMNKGWINSRDGRKLYYCVGDGKLATEEYKVGNDTYYFAENGEVLAVKKKTDNLDVFFDMDDEIISTGWIVDNEGQKRMYISEDRGILTGYQIIGNRAYYFNERGKIENGMQIIEGKPYYFPKNNNGANKNSGWLNFVNGKKAYTTGYGELLAGKHKVDGKWYDFRENGYLKLERKGIDVSVFQGTIDWKKVKNDGIDFALIRTGGRFGGGGSIYDDDTYYYNMDNAIKNGIDVGVYFFTQAINTKEAVEEARYTCNKLKGYDVRMPVVIDTEYLEDCRHNRLSRAQRTAVVKAFCKEVKRQGYEPMIYSNLLWLENNLNMSELREYKVWVAQYYTQCDYEGPYNCWQYTSDGKVNGIKGRVDMNIWYE